MIMPHAALTPSGRAYSAGVEGLRPKAPAFFSAARPDTRPSGSRCAPRGAGRIFA
jgi:hypothetical protein